MIDNHDAFAGLEEQVNVAGNPLTVVVDAQKRCFNQDRFRLEELAELGSKSIEHQSDVLCLNTLVQAVGAQDSFNRHHTLRMLRTNKFSGQDGMERVP